METTSTPASAVPKEKDAQPKTPPKTSESSKSLETVNAENAFKSVSPQLKESLTHEVNQMMAFAVYNGKTVNTDVIPLIQNDSVDDLIHAHNLLCANVAPATPKSIAYTFQLREKNKDKSLLTKLPLVRNLIIMAIIFLITFILTGQSPLVNDASLDLGVMNNHGIDLLFNLGYLVSISGIGVIFYLLKNVTTAVKNSTLIPEDSIYYVALVVLGLISGLVISEILGFYVKDPNNINLFNKSVLALIGGFSTDAIFSVLQGIIDKLKALFTTSK
ncbi:hypothetical protein LX97_02012 [Nonlabens dokdonensis]|uniref:Uncharacterized protein n=2 Tax=Nonlabens dokdonensis TaxID=328515 RepID=L7WCM0_NONDD|nr:hypothetical protein [Nonlabens dokdonensis]AGC77809.1 hypothetical protein DDD_2682 [Nonlabens dokdonensis DSW-6]PZX39658.1 hypothetical protein LX97_02012 [Nonlabens dokdonensis]